MRQGFATEQEIQEGVALVQLYPGPIMVDLAVFLGYRNRGTMGAFVATLGFVLPSFVVIVLASEVYLRSGTLPGVESMILGVGALVLGVVLHMTWDFAQANLSGIPEALLALLAFVLGILHANPLWAILIGFVVGMCLHRDAGRPKRSEKAEAIIWSRLAIAGVLSVGLVTVAWWAWTEVSPLSGLLLVFLKIGAFAFGNGTTILPVMQHAVIEEHQWLSAEQFNVAIALGYVTPGPILISAACVGYLVAGLDGAVVSTLAIFAPSFVMTLIATELYLHVRHLEPVRRAVRGIMAVFVGLLASVVLSLMHQALMQPVAFVFAGGALVALRHFKWGVLPVFGVGLVLWAGLVLSGMIQW